MAIKPDTLALFPMWFVAFLLSLTCHEAAHALAAKWGGDPTAFHGGQVTLNPLPHPKREPFRTIFFPLLPSLTRGWMRGWARPPSAPSPPRTEPPPGRSVGFPARGSTGPSASRDGDHPGLPRVPNAAANASSPSH